MRFFVFRTSNFLGFGIAIGLAISWIIYTIFGHSWAFPCWGFLPVFWLYCGRLPWSGYSQSLRDCMPLSRKLSRRGSLRSSRWGIRNRCAIAYPLAGAFCTLVGVFAIAALLFTPLSVSSLRSLPGSGFAMFPCRGIRNRCAIACPLAEAANTFRFCFAADCVRGYVARPSPLTQASLRRGRVAQLARFAGKTKPVKVLTLTGVGVAGFEPAASSSRTKHATKLRHTPCVLQPLNYTDEPKYQKSRPLRKSAPRHESHPKLPCAGKHRAGGPTTP